MGGLILDNIVVFLFRAIRVFVGDLLSSKWSVVRGIVTGASADKDMYPSANITYEYEVGGASYDGRLKRGFWYDSSAEKYARDFPTGSEVVIRYSPLHPSRSFLVGAATIPLNSESE